MLFIIMVFITSRFSWHMTQTICLFRVNAWGSDSVLTTGHFGCSQGRSSLYAEHALCLGPTFAARAHFEPCRSPLHQVRNWCAIWDTWWEPLSARQRRNLTPSRRFSTINIWPIRSQEAAEVARMASKRPYESGQWKQGEALAVLESINHLACSGDTIFQQHPLPLG